MPRQKVHSATYSRAQISPTPVGSGDCVDLWWLVGESSVVSVASALARVRFCTVWPYALWGLVGAAANCGVAFLEAKGRVQKGWPWADPDGPGGGYYAASIAVHFFLGAAAASMLANAHIVDNTFVAFGVGVGAVAVVKKAGKYAIAAIPSKEENDQQQELRGNDPLSGDRGDNRGA